MTQQRASDAAGLPQDPGRSARIGAARAELPGVIVERFERAMFETDSAADALVEAFSTLPQGAGWQLLDRALASTNPQLAGAPPELARLLGPLLSPPPWVDFARIEAGASIWWRFLPANVIGLSGSLLIGYQHGDLIKPQAFSGRSVQLAGRRFEETGRWMYSATEPGGLYPGRPGFCETVRVRLLHAVIRKQLRARVDWDRRAWGDPIHMAGTCLTNLAFLVVPQRVSELLGARFSADELESMRQLWCWVGHLMGLPEDLLPPSLDWAHTYTRAARIILAPPDRDSLELTQSALRGAVRAERMLPEPLWKLTAPLVRPLASRLVYGNSQAILGSLGDVPGKQPRRTHLAVRLLRPWVWRRERARLAGRLGSDLQIALSQRAAYQRQLARVKAAERPFAPREADGVSPARPELCSGP